METHARYGRVTKLSLLIKDPNSQIDLPRMLPRNVFFKKLLRILSHKFSGNDACVHLEQPAEGMAEGAGHNGAGLQFTPQQAGRLPLYC